MTDMIKERLMLVCPNCQNKNHQWKEAYYGDTFLKRVDKHYIAWCEEERRYVIQSLAKNKTSPKKVQKELISN